MFASKKTIFLGKILVLLALALGNQNLPAWPWSSGPVALITLPEEPEQPSKAALRGLWLNKKIRKSFRKIINFIRRHPTVFAGIGTTAVAVPATVLTMHFGVPYAQNKWRERKIKKAIEMGDIELIKKEIADYLVDIEKSIDKLNSFPFIKDDKNLGGLRDAKSKLQSLALTLNNWADSQDDQLFRKELAKEYLPDGYSLTATQPGVIEMQNTNTCLLHSLGNARELALLPRGKLGSVSERLKGVKASVETFVKDMQKLATKVGLPCHRGQCQKRKLCEDCEALSKIVYRNMLDLPDILRAYKAGLRQPEIAAACNSAGYVDDLFEPNIFAAYRNAGGPALPQWLSSVMNQTEGVVLIGGTDQGLANKSSLDNLLNNLCRKDGEERVAEEFFGTIDNIMGLTPELAKQFQRGGKVCVVWNLGAAHWVCARIDHNIEKKCIEITFADSMSPNGSKQVARPYQKDLVDFAACLLKVDLEHLPIIKELRTCLPDFDPKRRVMTPDGEANGAYTHISLVDFWRDGAVDVNKIAKLQPSQVQEIYDLTVHAIDEELKKRHFIETDTLDGFNRFVAKLNSTPELSHLYSEAQRLGQKFKKKEAQWHEWCNAHEKLIVDVAPPLPPEPSNHPPAPRFQNPPARPSSYPVNIVPITASCGTLTQEAATISLPVSQPPTPTNVTNVAISPVVTDAGASGDGSQPVSTSAMPTATTRAQGASSPNTSPAATGDSSTAPEAPANVVNDGEPKEQGESNTAGSSEQSESNERPPST